MQLVYYPDPILRKRAPPLQRIDDEVRTRVREMFEIMYREHGIGLAAPQVGWSTRLFVLNIAGDPEEGEELVYINPRIVSSDGEVVDEEGCLSIPDIRGKVARKQKVIIEAQDLDGSLFEEEAEDLHARALQHELDHLDGILFVQLLSAADKLLIRGKLKKLATDGPKRTQSSP